jgi:acylphosphatase
MPGTAVRGAMPAALAMPPRRAVPAGPVRRHLWISGRVQGVWFRESVREQAELAGVVGWVKNLVDGRVEALLEGHAAAVRRLEAWCHHGPSSADVQGVEGADEPTTGEFVTFRVVR